jgi:RNA methyltransferase, TrmH family
MLTKSTIKFIKSLQEKKYRKQEQCFVVEGGKSVLEVLSSDYEVILMVATADFLQKLQRSQLTFEVIAVKKEALVSLGNFQTNDAALAVVRMKETTNAQIPPNQHSIVLDSITDPGNLGTIIRTADWYGINSIFASVDTVDFYSPKVITSSKGSFTRVKFTPCNLSEILYSTLLPVYGTFLEGSNVHTLSFGNAGVIVIGNEARGISGDLEKYVTNRITIPRYGKAESLNAAVATAIILDNIKR